MSIVDKIYGTYTQYSELWSYCKKNKPTALNYFYQRDPFYDQDKIMVISLFPEEIDKWLLKNCKIEWVKERIKGE
jgi:hypothetical protein